MGCQRPAGEYGNGKYAMTWQQLPIAVGTSTSRDGERGPAAVRTSASRDRDRGTSAVWLLRDRRRAERAVRVFSSTCGPRGEASNQFFYESSY